MPGLWAMVLCYLELRRGGRLVFHGLGFRYVLGVGFAGIGDTFEAGAGVLYTSFIGPA